MNQVGIEILSQLVVLVKRLHQHREPVKGLWVAATEVQLVSMGKYGGTQGIFQGIEVGVAHTAKLAEKIVFVDDDLDRRCQKALLEN